jgi:hypothetical protein
MPNDNVIQFPDATAEPILPAEPAPAVDPLTRPEDDSAEDVVGETLAVAADSVPPAPPTEGAGIKCAVCGTRPFAAEFGPEGTRSDFNLLRLTAKGLPAGEGEAGEWRCSMHFEDRDHAARFQ